MAKLDVLEPVQHDQYAFDPAESRADVDELAATAVEREILKLPLSLTHRTTAKSGRRPTTWPRG
jgi:hypothetical protein